MKSDTGNPEEGQPLGAESEGAKAVNSNKRKKMIDAAAAAKAEEVWTSTALKTMAEGKRHAIRHTRDRSQLEAIAVAKLVEQIREAQKDPVAFVEFAMRTPRGDRLALAPFHKEWLRAMHSKSRVIIEAPRGHGKTSCVIGYALFALGANSNLRIKFVCQNDARAKERLFEFRTNLESNPALKMVFPNLKQADVGDWTKTKLYVEREARTRDPSFEAIGILSSVTGSRPDLVICDDIADLRNAILYPALREDVKQKFFGELEPAMEVDGRIIAICTPYHAADINAVLKANSEWTYVRHVVGDASDPFKPLWPEHWSRDKLEGMRRRVGSVEFARAYQCVALSGDVVPCRPEWIKYYDKELLGDPNALICVQGYDLAISQATSADYFACVTLLYSTEKNLVFVADAFKGRLSFADQGMTVINNAQRWRPDKISIESVGLGGALENFLRERAPVPLPLFPYRPRGDKQRRFLETTPLFEDGRVFFHPNLDPQRNVLIADRGDLISELLEFPLSKHDDMVDAFTCAVQALSEFRVAEPEEGWTQGESTRVRLSVLGS